MYYSISIIFLAIFLTILSKFYYSFILYTNFISQKVHITLVIVPLANSGYTQFLSNNPNSNFLANILVLIFYILV